MICKNCHRKINHIAASVFDRDGSDYMQLFPLFEVPSDEHYYAGYFETDANWTGYDLSEQEMNETIHCPVCGKNPFPDQEVQVCDIVRVVKFVDIDVEGEACE